MYCRMFVGHGEQEEAGECKGVVVVELQDNSHFNYYRVYWSAPANFPLCLGRFLITMEAFSDFLHEFH